MYNFFCTPQRTGGGTLPRAGPTPSPPRPNGNTPAGRYDFGVLVGTTMTAENANWNHGGDLNQTVDIGQFSTTSGAFSICMGTLGSGLPTDTSSIPDRQPCDRSDRTASGWNRVRRGGGWGSDEAACVPPGATVTPRTNSTSGRFPTRLGNLSLPHHQCKFHDGHQLWFSDEANATDHGHIRDWNGQA